MVHPSRTLLDPKLTIGCDALSAITTIHFSTCVLGLGREAQVYSLFINIATLLSYYAPLRNRLLSPD